MDIAAIVEHCKESHKPCERDASFDYCFNYFQEFKEAGDVSQLAAPQHLQMSCLHIAFFLASWGMLRGKGFLLQKSLKFYVPLIRGIADVDQRIWTIDVDSYCDVGIKLVLDCQKMIGEAFRPEQATELLVTKIMLGVFGNIPAYDTYFCAWLRSEGFSQQLNQQSLREIAGFYQAKKSEIDAIEEFTIDFTTGKATHRKYPKALIIDMVGFTQGQKEIRKKAAARSG